MVPPDKTGQESMLDRLHRWTEWAGGPRVLAVVLLVQIAALGLFALKPLAAISLVIAIVGAVIVLEHPVLGVGLLLEQLSESRPLGLRAWLHSFVELMLSKKILLRLMLVVMIIEFFFPASAIISASF